MASQCHSASELTHEGHTTNTNHIKILHNKSSYFPQLSHEVKSLSLSKSTTPWCARSISVTDGNKIADEAAVPSLESSYIQKVQWIHLTTNKVQWILCLIHDNSFRPSGIMWLHRCLQSLVLVMAWCLFGTKPLPEPMMTLIYDAKWHHQATLGWSSNLNLIGPVWLMKWSLSDFIRSTTPWCARSIPVMNGDRWDCRPGWL